MNNDIKMYHNSQDLYFRKPFGAVECGKSIDLFIEIMSKISNMKVELIVIQGADIKFREMQFVSVEGDKKLFKLKEKMPGNSGLVWYYFRITINGEKIFYGNNDERLGGEGVLTYKHPLPYQITVYNEVKVASWYKENIMYQIFVDRFYSSESYYSINKYKKNDLIHADWNDSPYYIKDEKGAVVKWDFFKGNLKGIIEKIPYLKSMGIGILYLNPIFEAASNHKYDTGNYKKIDEAFGTEEILIELISAANKYGINIILDGVFSHTGSDSLYFNKDGNYDSLGAYESKDSEFYDWYRFEENSNKYECWWGVDTLPNVEEMNPVYLDYIVRNKNSVIKHWINCGIKGWRLDVADELPDEFIKEIKKSMNERDKDSVLIGEVWEDASNKVSYDVHREYLLGEELDSVMNYPFREVFIGYILGNISGVQAKNKMMSLYENYPKEQFFSLMNLIGGHDRIRILTLLGEAPYEGDLDSFEKSNYKLIKEQKELAIKRLKLLSLIQLTFPGVPCIYYGDEVGVQGYSDPYNRGTYPWGRENKELLDWYIKITKLRNENDTLKKGQWKPFIVEEDIFSFIREYNNESIYCIFNRNKNEKHTINIGERIKGYDLIEQKKIEINNTMVLESLQGKIISIRTYN